MIKRAGAVARLLFRGSAHLLLYVSGKGGDDAELTENENWLSGSIISNQKLAGESVGLDRVQSFGGSHVFKILTVQTKKGTLMPRSHLQHSSKATLMARSSQLPVSQSEWELR